MASILEELLQLLGKPGTRVAWSRYRSTDEAVQDMAAHLERIENNDLSQFRELERLFAPLGAINGIAVNNGCYRRFEEIEKKFYRAAKVLRSRNLQETTDLIRK